MTRRAHAEFKRAPRMDIGCDLKPDTWGSAATAAGVVAGAALGVICCVLLVIAVIVS